VTAGLRSFTLTPSTVLEQSTTYQVTLSKEITSATGIPMSSDYIWHFTTKASTAPCPIDRIYIEPRDTTVGGNVSTPYTGYAIAPFATNCTVINGNSYNWVWEIDDKNIPEIGVSLTGGGPSVSVRSGTTSGNVKVKAETEGKKDEATLNVFIDTCTKDAECQANCPGSVCDIPTKHCLPVIKSLTPDAGPKGRWVTISGCYFKNDRGQVEFGSGVVTTYPCGGKWTDKEIIVAIPDSSYSTPSSLPVFVTDVNNLKNTSPLFFSLIDSCVSGVAIPASGLPGLCSLSPASGQWGSAVTLNGENFGTAKGTVSFTGSTGSLNSTVDSWSGTAISTSVPTNAATGLVKAVVNNCPSNGLTFTIPNGGVNSPCDSQTNTSVCNADNALCWPGLICDKTSCLCRAPDKVSVISVSPAALTAACRNALVSATFDQLMDHSTLNSNTVKVWTEAVTGCSSPINVSAASHGFFARVWSKIKNIFNFNQAQAATGDGCPIGGTISSYDVGNGAEGCTSAEGCTVVTFSPYSLMPATSDYAVTIKGGADGVKSALGGELNTNASPTNFGPAYQWKFNSSNEICQIHHVDINITYRSGTREATRADASSDYFTCAGRDNCPDDIDSAVSGNQHRYAATAKARDNQELQAVYGWTENDPDDLVSIATLDAATTNITPAKQSGQSTVSVTASDFNTSDDIHYGTSTASVAITNFICENPWPDISAGFPYADSTGNCNRGGGSCYDMTFSTFYCRDAGQTEKYCQNGSLAGEECAGDSDCNTTSTTSYKCAEPTADDLPALIPNIKGVQSGSCIGGPDHGKKTCTNDSDCSGGGVCYNTLKDYLFLIDNSNKKCSVSNSNCSTDTDCPVAEKCTENTDSLGIRIYNNGDHLSPPAWARKYENNPASGGTATVDGYESMTAGRTTYVNMAVNSDPAGLFTNMFLLSHTNNPKAATAAIYNQLLKNISFSTSVSNNRVCTNSSMAGVYCLRDSDCGVGGVCDAQKDKLARDVIRMGHLKQIIYSLEMYRGHCSINTNLPCKTNTDCPQHDPANTNSETCLVSSGTYPTLTSGTYLAGESVSVWDSWGQTFANVLGKSPLLDPYNKAADCPEGYNAECWNDLTKDFQCNPGSYMYHYKVSGGGTGYNLYANMEYLPVQWKSSTGFTTGTVSQPCSPGVYNLMFTK